MVHNDNQKMIDFISSQLPGGEATLILATGIGGSVIAYVTVQDDELEIESNCPEWVSVREVYEHLRWKAMPGWEQQAWLRTTRYATQPRLDGVADRLEQAVARLERIPVTTEPPELSSGKVTEYGPIRVNMALKEATIFGKTFPIDDLLLDILACLVEAQGNWITRADMQSSSRLLKDEERLDRSISRLKNFNKVIEPLIESSSRGYRLRPLKLME